MKTINLWLNGCDDSTKIRLKVSEAQEEFLRELVEKSEAASTTSCEPTMEIEEENGE